MNVQLNNGQLGDRIWHQHTRALMPEYVRVIGRVIGKVFIRDIAKEVRYNQVVDILITDAKRSDDLVRAISQKWVDIVYGKEFLDKKKYSSEILRQPSQTQFVTNNARQTVDLSEVKVLASQIAQDAANRSVMSIRESLDELQESIKNSKSSSIDVDQVIKELTTKLPQQAQVNEKSKFDDEIANNVFINLDEQKELKTNIQQDGLGTVTKRKGKKAKMTIKRLKHINKGDGNGNV